MALLFYYHHTEDTTKSEILSNHLEPVLVHLPYMSDANILKYFKGLISSLYMRERSELYKVGSLKRLNLSRKHKIKQLDFAATLSGYDLWIFIKDVYLAGIGLNKLPNFREIDKVPGSSHMTKRKRG